MKKLIFCLFIFGFSYNFAQAQFNFGAGATLILDSGTLGGQTKALYEFSDSWRGAGTFTYYLNDGAGWGLDFDAHYLLLDVDNDFVINPFGGINIIDFGVETEIGINLGAFIEFTIADDKDVYFEPKFIIGDVSSITLSAGIKL